MTRRDTILMAVLINAGLLVILFATAITKDPVTAEPIARAVERPAAAQPVAVEPRETLDVVVARHTGVSESPLVVGTSVALAERHPDGIAPVPIVVAPTSVASTTDNQWIDITVKRGDTLEKIARANGATVSALMEANDLSSTRLQIGDTLRLLKLKPEEVVECPVVRAADHFYTIRSGDNPYVVAMKLHIPLDDLLQLNDLNEDSARRLKPGDRIRIP